MGAVVTWLLQSQSQSSLERQTSFATVRQRRSCPPSDQGNRNPESDTTISTHTPHPEKECFPGSQHDFKDTGSGTDGLRINHHTNA